MLDCIERQPDNPADAAVIWLHGLGADGNDFVPILGELGLPRDHGIRFVFPNAPTRPVTLNGGMAMPAWYDILGVDVAAREDAEGINAAREEIEALIAREVERGLSAERIVLAGFSQGGAVALHTGLRHSARLAGIMALSTWLPLSDRLPIEAGSANRGLPIFMAHGELDPMVPMPLGESSRDLLSDASYDVEWHNYPMEHQVCMEEIHAVGAWLRTLLY